MYYLAQAFCKQKQYCNNNTVIEDKLFFIIIKEVAGQPLKGKSCKANNNILQEEIQLLQQSVYGYITALTDLYWMQKAIKINSHLFLWEDSIREYLKTLQWRDVQHKKKQFVNKGRDTLFDSYTKDEF